jgi:hypothetical protein
MYVLCTVPNENLGTMSSYIRGYWCRAVFGSRIYDLYPVAKRLDTVSFLDPEFMLHVPPRSRILEKYLIQI